MQEARGIAIVASAALCAVVAGCGSAPNLGAQGACTDFRKASADYQDGDIDIEQYVALLQEAARMAEDGEDPDLVRAGALLERAPSIYGVPASSRDLATMTRAADRMDEACEQIGL